MSEFSETPAVEENIAYSADLSDDIIKALNKDADEPLETVTVEETKEGENYPDTEQEEEIKETEETEEETEETEEETKEEDETDSEVQSVVEDLQKQADACGAFLGAKGLDYNAIRDRYLEKGRMAQSDIKALEAVGISEELIQGYIEGQQARYEVYARHIKDMAGGDEGYEELMQWAAKNLTDKEIKHFDKAVESNDVDEARFAVKGLLAMRDKAKGKEPKLVHGRTEVRTPPIKGFSSLAEQARAQSDPRYEIDEEYTKMVDRRIMASNY